MVRLIEPPDSRLGVSPRGPVRTRQQKLCLQIAAGGAGGRPEVAIREHVVEVVKKSRVEPNEAYEWMAKRNAECKKKLRAKRFFSCDSRRKGILDN